MGVEAYERLMEAIISALSGAKKSAFGFKSAEINLRMFREGLSLRAESPMTPSEEALNPEQLQKVSASLAQAHGQLHPEDN